jgi:protein gp37
MKTTSPITDEMFANGKFWTDAWSLVDGCTPVSPGCLNCWLKAMQERFGHGQGDFEGNAVFREDRLDIPARQKKPRIYAVWSDLYHEAVSFEDWHSAIIQMRCQERHTFLIITKRPERAVEYYSRLVPAVYSNPAPNIIHIATMENQDMADKRMPHLLRIPGKRGIIIEPMLGPVDFSNMETYEYLQHRYNSTKAAFWIHPLKKIHQVILGPENGKGKRPFEEEWAESVKAQCEGAGVPFYRKDKGEGELIWARQP